MKSYRITREDLLSRVCFIIKLVQNQFDVPMPGRFASKTDSMGGICDRFINTLSDTLVFDRILFENHAFKNTGNQYSTISDYYYYKVKQARKAPDVIGIKVNSNIIPFAVFNNGWEQVPGTPNIEVKSSKAKDQMISLIDQGYDYLVFVDLSLRVDYLVPFINQSLFDQRVLNSMKMDNSVFIIKDDNNFLTSFENIDFSDNEVGEIKLLSVTKADSFKKQATWCDKHVSVWRIKDIKARKQLIRDNPLNIPLEQYLRTSSRIASLYEFNDNWRRDMKIEPAERNLDLYVNNLQAITVLKRNKTSIVITSTSNDCIINGIELKPDVQYNINFELLDRRDSDFEEFFIQKECAEYLKSFEDELIQDILTATKCQ